MIFGQKYWLRHQITQQALILRKNIAPTYQTVYLNLLNNIILKKGITLKATF